MNGTISEDIDKLQALPAPALRLKFQQLFGESSASRNRTYLIRRIAWRLQANAWGDLSERARRRALEIAHDADLRLLGPEHSSRRLRQKGKRPPSAEGSWDQRLPLPGTVLTRHFQGRTIEVKVLPHGFAYEQRWFRSLSGIAEQVTGTRWNGFVFFGLQPRQRPHAA